MSDNTTNEQRATDPDTKRDDRAPGQAAATPKRRRILRPMSRGMIDVMPRHFGSPSMLLRLMLCAVLLLAAVPAAAQGPTLIDGPAAIETKGAKQFMANVNTHTAQLGVEVQHNFRLVDEAGDPMIGVQLGEIEIDVLAPDSETFVTYSLVASSPSSSEKVAVETGNGWYRANLGRFLKSGELLVLTYDATNTERRLVQQDSYVMQRSSRVIVGAAFDPKTGALRMSATLESPPGVSAVIDILPSTFALYRWDEFEARWTIGATVGGIAVGQHGMFAEKADWREHELLDPIAGGDLLILRATVFENNGVEHEGFAHFMLPFEAAQ